MSWKAISAEKIEDLADVPGYSGPGASTVCAGVPAVVEKTDMPDFDVFERKCLKDSCSPDWTAYLTSYGDFLSNDPRAY
jgi:hypothetical protein